MEEEEMLNIPACPPLHHLDVPAGFKFEPTDEELITYYLLPKINGMALPCGIVTEKSIYGQNSTPWGIFDDQNDPWIQSSKCKNKKTIYAFTKLKKKSKGKKQIERTAGCGTWDGQTAPRIIKNSHGKNIGSRKYFSFESKNFGQDYIRTYGHWGMHEFSVSDGGDYVLCAITRDDSKRLVNDSHQETPLIDVVQSNTNDLGSDRRTNDEDQSARGLPLEELEVASGSSVVHQVPLEELEVASEFDPKLSENTVPLQVQNEVLDQHTIFGNSSVSQGSTMIEYEGFRNPGEFQPVSTTIFVNPSEIQGSIVAENDGFKNLREFQGSTLIESDSYENLGEFLGPAMLDYWQLAYFTANNLGTDRTTSGKESTSGSVHQVALDELEDARGSLVVHHPLEYEPKLLLRCELVDQCTGFGNSSSSQRSTVIEYGGFGNPGDFQAGSTMEYNGFANKGEFQAESTMCDFYGFENLGEFQGSTMVGCGQQWEDLEVNNLQNQGEGHWNDNIFDSSFLDAMPISTDDDILDLSFLDGISIDEVSEPLFFENQVLGKRKLLEEAENPCGKKLWNPYTVNCLS